MYKTRTIVLLLLAAGISLQGAVNQDISIIEVLIAEKARNEKLDDNKFLDKKIIDKSLLTKIIGKSNKEKIKVVIGFNMPYAEMYQEPEVVRAEISQAGDKRIFINGEEKYLGIFEDIKEKRLTVQRKKLFFFKKQYKENFKLFSKNINMLHKKSFFKIKEAYENAESMIVVTLTIREIEVLSKLPFFISGIEEYKDQRESFATISTDGGANFFLAAEMHQDIYNETNNNPNSMIGNRGSGVNIIVQEATGAICPTADRYDDYSFFRAATGTSGHGVNVVEIIKTLSPDSTVACTGNSKILETGYDISTNSWSYNDSHLSAEYTINDKYWDSYPINGTFALYATGNEAESSGTISVNSPAKSINTVGIGAYNLVSEERSPYSSYRDPLKGNMKPEVSAPSDILLNSGVYMDGTSASTPVAAAIVANFMSDNPGVRGYPYLMKALLLASSNNEIFSPKSEIGQGGIDLNDLKHNYSWSRYGNYGPGNGVTTFTTKKYVYAGQEVVASASWLVDPNYSYNHRTDKYIGKDYDLRVKGPSGQGICSSGSWSNAFETCSFTAQESGEYTVEAYLYSDNNPYSKTTTTYPWYYFTSDKVVITGMTTHIAVVLNVK